MKRDLDFIRAMLITAENSDGPVGEAELLSIEPDARKVAYHLELMEAHGLVTFDTELVERKDMRVAAGGLPESVFE